MSDQAPGGAVPAGAAPKPAGDSANAQKEGQKPQEGQKPPQESAEAKEKKFIDLDGEQVDLEEIKRDRKKWKGADNKFRETAEEKKAALKARKEVEDFLSAVEEDPTILFQDPRFASKKEEIAHRLLREKVQRELEEGGEPGETEAEKELRKYKEKEKKDQETAEKKKRDLVVQHRQQQLGKLFNEAIEASPLAKDPKHKAEVVAEMARYVRLCRREYGYSPDAKEIAQHVAEQRLSGYKLAASGQDEDSILDFFGDEIAERLMQAKLKRLRASRSAPTPPQTEQNWESRHGQEKSKREYADPNELARLARKR